MHLETPSKVDGSFFMCACSLIQCQSALHACTLLQWRVQTYALLVQLPMQVFLPPDIPRGTCVQGTVGMATCGACCSCCLASSLEEGGQFPTGYDLGQGQANSSGSWLCCVEYRRWRTGGPWVQGLGMGEGACWGSGESVRVHLGPCVHIHVTSGSRFPGHSGTAWLSWKQQLPSCKSPLVQQDGRLPCLLPSPWGDELDPECSSGHPPGDDTASTVWKQCPGGCLRLIVDTDHLFTDRWVSVCIGGNSTGRL